VISNVCPYAGDIFTVNKSVTLHVLFKNIKIKKIFVRYIGSVWFSHMSHLEFSIS
jgi:hypothetical protein